MASFRNLFVLLTLCALLGIALGQTSQGGPHSDQGGSGGPQWGSGGPQGGPHVNQGRSRRQVAQGGQGGQRAQVAEDEDDGAPVSWTTCDYNVDPRLSCADCHTRVICKPIGGLVKACQNPNRPYCNNGLCSPVPSVDCV